MASQVSGCRRDQASCPYVIYFDIILRIYFFYEMNERCLSGRHQLNMLLYCLGAAAQGVQPDQIIFTDVAMKQEHIRRSALADLFLDTYVLSNLILFVSSEFHFLIYIFLFPFE